MSLMDDEQEAWYEKMESAEEAYVDPRDTDDYKWSEEAHQTTNYDDLPRGAEWSEVAHSTTGCTDNREAFLEDAQRAIDGRIGPNGETINYGDSVVIGPAYSGESFKTFSEHAADITSDKKRGKVKQSQAEGIKLRIRMLKKELKRLESRPAEPEEDGNVITFQKQFAAGGIVYSYAALKAKGLWYTTGPKSPKGYTWDELLDFIGDDNRIYLVTEATPLIGG
jgi:hypothetical protein